jgi:RHS repeat-associated protein
LPSTITFSDGSTITYSYAADGTKLRTVHSISGSGTSTQKDYCANVVYEDGVQKLLLTEEGYVDLSVTSPAYYYYLKDHQGNNRVVVSSGGTVAEVNHYYPFGGVFASSGNVQPYKYNGKELDTKKGLNWYDYGARHYDAMLGRWFVADPLAEKMYGWSPYAYCFNSPIKYVDEDGEFPWAALVGSAIEYGVQVFKNYQNGRSGYDAWFREIDFVKVTLSAFNPSGKLKLIKTLALEGLKETFEYTPNDKWDVKTNAKEIVTNTIENTIVSMVADKLVTSSSDDALKKVNAEMNEANICVRKAENQVIRHPNSYKSKTLLESAQIGADQIRQKQVIVQMLNSTAGEVNPYLLEQFITNSYSMSKEKHNEK